MAAVLASHLNAPRHDVPSTTGARPAAKPLAPPVDRVCTACTDRYPLDPDNKDLVRPCPVCECDYCLECMHEMFNAAVTDPTRMPPRCCAPLQLYTITSSMGDEEADTYRNKFAEWLAREKVYCPAPTCSVFIHEKYLPKEQTAARTGLLNETLQQILDVVKESPASRFFRTGESQAALPRYNEIVARPIDLQLIESRITAPG
jgi:hypothetical protein